MGIPTAILGHEGQFATRSLSGRSAFSEETFAGRCGNEKDAPRADGRPSGKVWHHVRGESWRLSSSFRSPIISGSLPASRYCPIRSIASNTVPTKPGDASRAERGSCSARFAVTAASVHARSHAWTWVFSIFSQSRPPKRAGQIPPRRPLSRGLLKPPEVFASCRGLGTRLG